MDKFNNSNSSLALQKFYNQQNNVRLLELQQRLKTEQIVCQIELTKAGSPDFVFRHSVINEEPGPPTVSSDAVQVINEQQVNTSNSALSWSINSSGSASFPSLSVNGTSSTSTNLCIGSSSMRTSTDKLNVSTTSTGSYMFFNDEGTLGTYNTNT